MEALSSYELRRRSAWRLGHGAVFFVFVCMLIVVVTLVLYGGLDLLELSDSGQVSSPTEVPQAE